MIDKQFDNFFKEKLQSYSAPVPEDMWSRIAQDKRKKRPVVFWFSKTAYGIYTVVAALMIIGGVAAWNQINEAPANAQTTIGKQEKTQPITKNNQSASDHSTSAIEANKATAIANSSSLNTHTETVKETEHHTEPIINKEKSSESDHSISINTAKKAIKNATNKETLGYKNKVVGNKATQATTNITASNKVSGTNADGDELTAVTNSEEDNLEIRPYNELSTVAMNSSKFNLGNINIKLSNPKQFSCPENNKHVDRDWYLEVYGSPEYTFKSIVNKGSTDNYLVKKDSAESMMMGYSFGLRLMKNITNNIYFKTGVQYTEYNENFSIQRENEHKITTVVTNKIVSRPQGDTTISDTSIFTQVGYSYNKTVNQYRNIEIPLLVSFRNEGIEGPWNWSLSAGVILNAYSWSDGNTIDTSLGIVSINSKGSNSVYTNSTLGVSLMMAASIERKLDGKWTAFAEPYFRYGISNEIISKFHFEERFNSAGLTFGLRYKFGNKQR